MKTFSYLKNVPVLEQLNVEENESGRFYVSPNGIRLASVTTVLGYSKKDILVEWKNKVGEKEAASISRRAGTRGTKFHAMLERYLKNESNVFEGIMPDMKQAFNDAKSTLDLIDNIHYIEAQLFSEALGVAGRTDVIAEYAEVPSIIDFKTSRKEKRKEWIDNYFEQGTAYSLMYEEMTGIQIHQVVVIISVDGLDKPQVFIVDRNDYIDSLKQKIDTYYKENNHVR